MWAAGSGWIITAATPLFFTGYPCSAGARLVRGARAILNEGTLYVNRPQKFCLYVEVSAYCKLACNLSVFSFALRKMGCKAAFRHLAGLPSAQRREMRAGTQFVIRGQ